MMSKKYLVLALLLSASMSSAKAMWQEPTEDEINAAVAAPHIPPTDLYGWAQPTEDQINAAMENYGQQSILMTQAQVDSSSSEDDAGSPPPPHELVLKQQQSAFIGKTLAKKATDNSFEDSRQRKRSTVIWKELTAEEINTLMEDYDRQRPTYEPLLRDRFDHRQQHEPGNHQDIYL